MKTVRQTRGIKRRYFHFPPVCHCCAAFLLCLTGSPAADINLDIESADNQVILSWPALSQSHELQTSPDLAGVWEFVTQLPVIVQSRKTVVLDRSGPRRFFRLAYPLVPGPDLPDGSFTDTNGDGIDGDVLSAIFVAPSGIDAMGRGFSPDTPCRSLAFALATAAASSRTGIYVQAGRYAEHITLSNGIGIYGGFDIHWLRAPNATEGHTVEVTGVTDAPTVTANGITLQAVLADLSIQAVSATGTVNRNGRSSCAIRIAHSAVRLERLLIRCGNGADGLAGTSGTNASETPAPAGASGGDAGVVVAACDDFSRGSGGAPGMQSFTAGSDPTGGGGGAGGLADTDCDWLHPNYAASSGSTGFPAAVTGSGFGTGGIGAPANSGIAGQPGTDGRTTDGLDGTGGLGGIFAAGSWFSNPGGNGTLGDNGTGGGGGGGSGGDDYGGIDGDSWGAGGGGGGAGGLRAPTVGTGGGGGGASIGIEATGYSNVLVTDCWIIRGSGGNAGNGGDGGAGQEGGSGGNGGGLAGNSMPGGRGGNGGRGGHSGAGGGGAGGDSMGILRQSTATVNAAIVTFDAGSAGIGGAGGVSPIGGGQSGYAGGVVDIKTF